MVQIDLDTFCKVLFVGAVMVGYGIGFMVGRAK